MSVEEYKSIFIGGLRIFVTISVLSVIFLAIGTWFAKHMGWNDGR